MYEIVWILEDENEDDANELLFNNEVWDMVRCGV